MKDALFLLHEKLDLLRGLTFFSGVDEEYLIALTENLSEMTLKPDEVLNFDSQTKDTIHIIITGQVTCNGRLFSEGEFFTNFNDDDMKTCRAEEKTFMLVTKVWLFADIFTKSITFAENIFKYINRV